MTWVPMGIWMFLGSPLVAMADAPATPFDLESWVYRSPAPRKPPVPRHHAVAHPIDQFIAAKLEAAGLTLGPEAPKGPLIRRATFDLLGLPPTPEEVQAFLADTRPDAYERLIDRLLASPHYGERWARHWLDLVRYADSNGFKTDATRPHAYHYRDYVIRSFNADKPYDRFVQEQLAGDELFPGEREAWIATGFYRHYPDEDNARNLPQRRQEILNDITDVVGSTFLGLTFQCARCHDHKYDPISQRDYFRLQAFFAGFKPTDLPMTSASALPLPLQHEWSKWEALRDQLRRLEAQARAEHEKRAMKVFPPEVQEALSTPAAARTPLQQQLVMMVQPQLEMKADELAKAMGKNEQWQRLREASKKFEKLQSAQSVKFMAYTDIGAAVPATFRLKGGAFGNLAEEVQPGFPSAFAEEDPASTAFAASTTATAAARRSTTGRRAALAHWLTRSDHPLTARVMVNRVWQHHFGRGIVANPSDFGVQGMGPSHPELLDWLAGEFVRGGWSLKRLHRLMMTSATYRQASDHREKALALDPENKLLWRYRRHRLDAESIRDAMLSVAGVLNRTMFGPGVFPPLPESIVAKAVWPVSEEVSQHTRRSIYVFVRRNQKYPLLDVLDLPDANIPCACRSTTTTAPQALIFLNSQVVLGLAQDLAGRLQRESQGVAGKAIERGYWLCFGRAPDSAERAAAHQFLEDQAEVIRGRNADTKSLALPVGFTAGADAARAAALVDFCHALLISNEFVVVD